MDKNDFIIEVRNLMRLYTRGFEIDDLMGTNNTTEGFIGECLDSYGSLLLSTTSTDDEVLPNVEDYFWNMVISQPGQISDEEIKELYDELTTPFEDKEEL